MLRKLWKHNYAALIRASTNLLVPERPFRKSLLYRSVVDLSKPCLPLFSLELGLYSLIRANIGETYQKYLHELYSVSANALLYSCCCFFHVLGCLLECVLFKFSNFSPKPYLSHI
jgi:hypothetical protein